MPSQPPTAGPPASPTPAQQRGRERRESIIRAAAALIDQVGPRGAALSAREIAREAGASVGTLYHYFADVDEIVAAVVERYAQDMLAQTDLGAVRPPPADWAELVHRSQEDFLRFFRSRPGLRDLWFDDRASSRVLDLHRHYRDVLAQRVRDALHDLTGTSLDLAVCRVQIAVSGALYELAFRMHPDGDEMVLGELRRVSDDFYTRHLGRVPGSGTADPPAGGRRLPG